jgi:hypothetical protein
MLLRSMAIVPLSPARGSARVAFTLMEVLMVVLIIALLIGLLVPGFVLWQRRARTMATKTTVDLLLAAAINYDPRGKGIWSTQAANGDFINYRMWDYNYDQIIDGLPELEHPDPRVSPTDPLRLSGYRGLVALTGVPVRRLDAAGRPLDVWKHPLRIAAASGVYGDAFFGVWSLGPDGRDGPPGSPDAADNICSWQSH